MKRIFALLTALALACALAACGGTGAQMGSEQSQSTPPASSSQDGSSSAANGEPNVLVACFSATGNTEGIARHIQTVLDADLYEIVPEEPYTREDLNYSNSDCRANREQNDPDARPAISGTLENPEDYDVVFLGYPIWWGQAPKIIHTFLESYDFAGVTIVPFCTSGSSGIGGSLSDIQALAPDANWLSGRRFDAGADQEEVARWVEGLELLSGMDGEFEGSVSSVE